MDITHAVYWTFPPTDYELKRRRFEAEGEEPLFTLPDDWTDLDESPAYAQWKRDTQYRALLDRLEVYELLPEGIEVVSPQPEPVEVPAEPSYPAGHVEPTRPVVNPMDCTHGCPCCGERNDIAETAFGSWMCEACGFDPHGSYIVDTRAPRRPPVEAWHRAGTTLYRDDEAAAQAVIYHEGEPVVPDAGPITEWAYPAEWDMPAVDMVVRRDDREDRRERGRAAALARRS